MILFVKTLMVSPELHWAIYDHLGAHCVKKLLRVEENQAWVKKILFIYVNYLAIYSALIP